MIACASRAPVDASPLLAQLAWFCEHGNLPKGSGKREGGNHPDGWGVAWRENGDIRCARGKRPAVKDPLLAKLQIRADRFIGHVRLTSNPKATGAENAHPFLLSGIALAHNGTFKGTIGEEGDKRRASDTLVFLELLSERWRERSLDGLCKTLGEMLADTELVGDYSAANLLIAAGEGLFALRRFSRLPDYYTLFVSEKDGVRTASSQKFGNAEWKPLGNGELFDLATGESRIIPLPGQAEVSTPPAAR